MVVTVIVAIPIYATEVTVWVKNDLNMQRQEVIEIDIATLHEHLSTGESGALVVFNALSQEIASQTTYDGKLLFEVSVRPNATATYTIKVGKRNTYTNYVYGNVYHERLDDLTWENDKTIYRMYGPALQKIGEHSFGTDVWTKSVPFLDAEKRYKAEVGMRETLQALKRQGQMDLVKHISDSISYHLDHGTGLDAYSVGPTLGCGAPALMDKGQLVMPYCWRECRILDNGPLRFTAHLLYNKTRVGEHEEVAEHRLVSLDKDSNFCRISVWYDGLGNECSLASGVVIHSADTTSIALGASYVLYADPTDRPQQLNQQIYVGTLYPYNDIETTFMHSNTSIKDVAGHALGITRYKPNERFTYFFGSAWSSADVRSWEEWQLVARQFIAARQSPLTISLQ